MINKMLLLLLLLINQSNWLIYRLIIIDHWFYLIFSFQFLLFFSIFFYFYLLIWTHSVEFLISYKYFFSSSLINFRWSRFFLAILSDISNRVIKRYHQNQSIHRVYLSFIWMFSLVFSIHIFFFIYRFIETKYKYI